MSWQDRPYHRDQGPYNDGESIGMGFPKPTRFVTYLLIINTAIFIINNVFTGLRVNDRFELMQVSNWVSILEAGKLITYQFLHADIWHLVLNMLGVYFLGTALEKYWGSWRFLFFYLFCGIVGGILFLFLASPFDSIVGASGAVLGLLAACAVLFPGMVIILYFFPVPIRIAAILLISLYALNTLVKHDLSDACHLGGMAAGFLFVMASPFWQRYTFERGKLRRQAMLEQDVKDQETVDKILQKVHAQGIQSLTWWEKKTLQRITRRQQQRDNLRKKGY